jgi:hypothetical protein
MDGLVDGCKMQTGWPVRGCAMQTVWPVHGCPVQMGGPRDGWTGEWSTEPGNNAAVLRGLEGPSTDGPVNGVQWRRMGW